MFSGGHIPAGRPAVSRGHSRRQAPSVGVHQRPAAAQHQDPRHPPAAPPQEC